jgi:hypothetical protein
MFKQQHATPPRWLSLDAAEQYTGVSRRQIQVWRAMGYIKSANIVLPGATRGRRVYDRESIDAFIESYISAPVSELVMNSKRKGAAA